MSDRPRVGVSRCLLGDAVRYDGGHKADPFLLDQLSAHVEWVPVCPEVESGMGVPREAVHLLASGDGVPSGAEHVQLIGVRSGTDWTAKMAGWSVHRAAAVGRDHMSGFILKKDSPSCGAFRVRVHHPRRAVSRTGRGLFAEALIRANPYLPVEEEGRLHDPRIRENFIERVFAFTRVQDFFRGRWSTGALVRFHTAHKLQLLSHSRPGYTLLGRLVAGAAGRSRREVAEQYQAGFMQTLAVMGTRGRHADVMQHMLGHLKRQLTPDDRQELLQLIAEYRAGVLPLIVPLTLFRHYVRLHQVAYLDGQTYLQPHPRELALRNHA